MSAFQPIRSDFSIFSGIPRSDFFPLMQPSSRDIGTKMYVAGEWPFGPNILTKPQIPVFGSEM